MVKSFREILQLICCQSIAALRFPPVPQASEKWHGSCTYLNVMSSQSLSAGAFSRKFLPTFLILIFPFTSVGLSREVTGEVKEKPGIAETGADQEGIRQQLYEGEKNGASFKNFHKDLGKNFLGLFSRENAVPFFIGLGGTGASLTLDDELHNYFRNVDDQGMERERFPAVGAVGEVLANHWVLLAGTGSLIVMGQTTSDDRLRAMSYTWTQGFVINNVLTEILKQSVRRERPNGENHRSFPSGHASNAFTFATIFNHYYGAKMGIPAYGVAAFVAFSRMEKNVHYLSDVVMGATIGYIVGRTVVRGSDKQRKVTWMPTISPDGEGVELMVSARF